MSTFFTKYGIEILLGLISAGALALCKHFHSRLKDIQRLYDNEEQEAFNLKIDEKLEPIYEELDELRQALHENKAAEEAHLKIIIASYRYRLMAICKQYLKQGYLTSEQYDQVTEFYKVYHDLGGNGQAKEYYDKVMQLEIHGDII